MQPWGGAGVVPFSGAQIFLSAEVGDYSAMRLSEHVLSGTETERQRVFGLVHLLGTKHSSTPPVEALLDSGEAQDLFYEEAPDNQVEALDRIAVEDHSCYYHYV